MDFGESVYILNNIFTSLHLFRKCYEVILSSLTWYSDFLFDFSIIRTLDGKVLHKYKHPAAVFGCDWSQNNKYVY